LLADTAAELQEKGIKQKASSQINKPQEQQQQQQELVLDPQQQLQQQNRQQELALPAAQQQQQQAHVAAHQGPDLMTVLGSWSMKQQPDQEKQQEQQALAS
jgi:hypothetical protein